MKPLWCLIPLILCGCEGLMDRLSDPQVQDSAARAVGSVPGAVAGDPASVINVALGILAVLGTLWGGKKATQVVAARIRNGTGNKPQPAAG